MQEQFYAEFIESISDIVDTDTLSKISKNLCVVMERFEITKKCADMVVYESIPAFVKTYLVTRKIEGLSINSLNLYELRLRQFFTASKKPIDKITANDIRVYLYYVQEQTKCTDRTLDSTRSILATFFKWANAEGYIQTNPCLTVKPIKYSKKERGYLSDIEIEKLRLSCGNLRDKAIIETLYSTGCRVSELINIKISDIDFDKKEVILFGKGSKYRKSYINARAEIAINNYLKSRTDNNEYLFVSTRGEHKNLSKDTIEKIVKTIGKKSGITKNVFPHLIRHTTATLGLQRGMDIIEIQKMLGHEKVETTLIYAELSDNSVKNSHKRCVV